MKTIKLMMLMAVLTLAWGCSSDSEGDEEQWNGSTFTPADKPAWAVDWTSTATKPDWKAPDLSNYELSMYYVVELDEELTSHSTDEDVMALFINGQCREVTVKRNRLFFGSVEYMLFFKGNSNEVGQPVELRYYCDKLHHVNTIAAFTTFVPNSGSTPVKDITKVLHLADGSAKYPVCTQLTVRMPQKLPFIVSGNDMLAVFVGKECRGVGVQQADGSWQVPTYSNQKGEAAQLRYYSAEKAGVYTILKTIKLDGANQQESISF